MTKLGIALLMVLLSLTFFCVGVAVRSAMPTEVRVTVPDPQIKIDVTVNGQRAPEITLAPPAPAPAY